MAPEGYPVATAGDLGDEEESSSDEVFAQAYTSEDDTDLDSIHNTREPAENPTDTHQPHHFATEDPHTLAGFIWGLDHPREATPPPHDPHFRRIMAEIQAATRTTAGPQGEAAAAEWGEGFEFDRATTTRHANLIEGASSNGRQALAEAGRQSWLRLNSKSPGRLNQTRATVSLSPDNPYLTDTLQLAADGGGVRVPVPDGFIPNCADGGQPPRLPSNTATVGGALRKMIHQAIIDRVWGSS